MSTKIKGFGLEDLICGVVPSYIDWNTTPTDGNLITDGDPETTCETGEKILTAGLQYAYFEWDLGGRYCVLCGGYGSVVDNASGTWHLQVLSKINGAWRWGATDLAYSGTSGNSKIFATKMCMAEKIRVGVTFSAAATISPKLSQFHIWRIT